jgi:anhydro-N-acetylmuramic acid kinase
MTRRWFIGMSSGSSLSGIDAALVRVEGTGLDMRLECGPDAFLHFPFTREMRDLLMRVTSGEPMPLERVGMLHRVLGETFSAAIFRLLDQTRFPREHVLALGFPGQTVWHDPDARFPTTLALGMASAVAEGTGITTLGDFRSRDVVVGGKGYPLTPLVDAMLFRDRREHRVLVDLGGFATIVSLQPGKDPWDVAAFQAAPCSMILDRLVHRLTQGREPFDAGGKHAVQGRCLDALLAKWLEHPALQQRPPRTFAADDYGDAFLTRAIEMAQGSAQPIHDLLCTATHFVARAIVDALRRYVPAADRVLLSGGGVRNGFLWRLLEDNLAPIPLERIDPYGIPAEARKAVAFAGLAALTLDGVPVNLPGVTGAGGSRLLGSFTPGSRENWARCLAWMASATSSGRLRAA